MKLTPRALLGHIDCPACGTAGGMRVTGDKNGEPFGYCEAHCHVQMRLGGNPQRVAAFLERYPHLKPKADPVTETVPEETRYEKHRAIATAPAPAPVTAPAPAANRQSANPFDFLLKGKAA